MALSMDFYDSFGILKVESYILTDNHLTKTNFLGLFRRTVNLQTLVQYHQKIVDVDYTRNPMNIVRLFTKEGKYLRYRKIILEFEQHSRMVLDERTINNSDFNKLYAKLKGFQGRRRK
jgi:hypothetical protein